MAQKTMYPAKSGSPYTTTTAAIGVSDTEIAVAELSVLPAAPNVCVIYVSAAKWERCLYSAKSNESGAGTITVSRSATGHASTDGSNGPLEFDAGAKVMRNFTAYDHDLFKDNIEDLAANKQPLDATLTAFADITTAANKLPYATGEDTFDVCDFTPLGQSLIGTTTASAVRDLIASASSTTATQNIYVDSAATGTGTGVDWANAFTTIQGAVNSLPAIVNHAVTIIIRKGSTPYNENITIQRVVAAGSIVIRGEYYWYGTVAASETGKITLGVSDYGYANRAQIAVGDIVWATKWSGAVGASAPTESIIDTVSSVSGAEVSLTTNAGKTIDTSWTYYITHTKFAFTGSNRITLQFSSVLIYGIHLHSIDAAQIAPVYNGKMSLNTCAITSDVSVSCIRGEQRAHISVYNTLIKSNGSGIGIHLLGRTLLDMNKCVLSGLNVGLSIGASDSNNWLANNHIMNTVNIGITAGGNSFIYVGTGSAATLIEAVTPKSPATSSDGSYIK